MTAQPDLDPAEITREDLTLAVTELERAARRFRANGQNWSATSLGRTARWLSRLPTPSAHDAALERRVREQVATETYKLCHWVQNVDGVQERESHRHFHFGHTCPYYAACSVAIGLPDPRSAL